MKIGSREFIPVLVTAAFVLVVIRTDSWSQALPDPPGPYCPLSATDVANLPSYGPGDRLVATYHLAGQGSTKSGSGELKGAPETDLLNNPAWHGVQIDRIVSASIDIILPLFGGVPGRYSGKQINSDAVQSKDRMVALVKALEKREGGGSPNPRVGMLYDTRNFQTESPYNYEQGKKIDLRTVVGRKHFYATIRDYFSLIPPRFWALWEGKPIVWLSTSEYSSGFDELLLPETRNLFALDFGGLDPFFVATLDWEGVGADWFCRSGLFLQSSYLDVSCVGPRLVRPDARGTENGVSYRDDWERALRASAPVVLVDTTSNRLCEPMEIIPTVEDEEECLQITHKYAQLHKSGEPVSPLPGPWAKAEAVVWSGTSQAHGLTPIEQKAGPFREVDTQDGKVLEMSGDYLYFEVDDAFSFCSHEPLALEVEHFDLPTDAGGLRVDYDSWDREATLHGIYKTTEEIPMKRRLRWTRQQFSLTDARLANNQDGGADFRIVAHRGLRIRSVKLSRVPTEDPVGGDTEAESP